MSDQPQSKQQSKPNAPKSENAILNLVANVVVPAVVLSKFSDEARLGPRWALVVALAVPVGYWLFDYAKRRKSNFLSILGIVSVLLSGGLGLFKLDGFWFAVKDAAIPGLIGIITLISVKTKYPLVKTIIYNETVIDVNRVNSELDSRGNRPRFDRLLVWTTLMLAGSFFLSAVLNFLLALYLLKSPAGTPEFNKELGKMTAMSYPVIVLPCMIVTIFAIWFLIRGIKGLTGLTADEIFQSNTPKG